MFGNVDTLETLALHEAVVPRGVDLPLAWALLDGLRPSGRINPGNGENTPFSMHASD